MIRKYFFILIAVLLSISFLYPILFSLTTKLTSQADGVFISWTIYTVSQYLATGQNIFQLPLFYPFINTLTYSDPFLSTAILNLPLLLITKNIILMHNFHLIIGTVVMYVSSYLLGKQLKYSTLGSFFTATIFTFSAMHLHYIVHLHTYLIAGIPLTFYFFSRWFNQNKWQWLSLTFGSFLYQILNSPMSGLFLIFCLIIFLSNKTLLQKIKNNLSLFGYYSSLTLVTLGLLYVPYFYNSTKFEYVRTIRDTAHFAHSLERLIQPDLLILFGLIFIFWKTRINNKKIKNLFSVKRILFIAVTGAVLMLGPALKINQETFKIFNIPIPLPYAVFYYIVPGFKAFRASSRWIILLNFGLSLLAGHFVTLSNLKKPLKITLLVLLTFSMYISNSKNLQLYSIPTKIPLIYTSLKSRNETVIAEFPAFSWRMMPYAYLENNLLLYQTHHKKTLYNGVSGFTPPIRERKLDWLWINFPNDTTVSYLKEQGVQLIIVHYDLYDEMYLNNFKYKNVKNHSSIELQKQIKNQENLSLINCEQQKCLYQLK